MTQLNEKDLQRIAVHFSNPEHELARLTVDGRSFLLPRRPAEELTRLLLEDPPPADSPRTRKGRRA